MIRQREEHGFVYFVETKAKDYLKIGWSTDPQSRLLALQVAMPLELNLIGFIPGSRNTEWDLHQRFAAYRVNGEWFRDCDELRQFIRGMGVITPESSDSSADEWQVPEELELLAWESQDKTPTPAMVKEVFSMLGRKGGPARAAALTSERRAEIARKAAQARWKKP